ncbi:hypothetical protein AB4544_19785, partial [Vibrio sp. 10N.222.45.F7]|uniref:hypothetical protein n=1 Tax=Vibrio sp. 10N.222.45.F7 TaxID=3229598 RepID=UPI0035530EC9
WLHRASAACYASKTESAGIEKQPNNKNRECKILKKKKPPLTEPKVPRFYSAAFFDSFLW